jgi:hypothetical protein
MKAEIMGVCGGAKKWAVVFGVGLAVGLWVGDSVRLQAVIQDCKVLGMFRVGDRPYSCVDHTVEIRK